jgi:hypothetical protein
MSSVIVRLVDEGLRMEEHPGIAFRDGPAGRRAGLAGGPDVWEVIAVLGDTDESSAAAAIAATAAWLGLSEAQVRAAEGYYSSYPDEIDALLAGNRAAHEVAVAAESVRRRLYRS